MAIKYLSKNNSLKIFSEAKVLSSIFQKWLLNKLIKKFDLYENLNGKIRPLNHAIINDSAELSELEIIEHRNFYKLEKINHISFEEFLECVKISFADIYVYPKGTFVNKIDLKNDKRIVAVIELQPDGDIDNIWIGNINQGIELLMINLIDEYNSN